MKSGYAMLGAAVANFARRWLPIGLIEPDLRPGPWYCYYLGDYLTAHPNADTVKSALVDTGSGEYIWATATPEWDREWFEKRGWEFPQKWVLYDSLRGLPLEFKEIG